VAVLTDDLSGDPGAPAAALRTPCSRCSEVHVTKRGGPACAGHSKRTGRRCENSPMAGQSKCRMHGGKSPGAERNAEERLQREAAERALAKRGFGQGRKVIDPADAMLELVYKSAANVEQLEAELGLLRPGVDRVRWDGRDEAVFDELDPEDRRHAPRIGAPIADSVVLYLEGRQTDTIGPHTLVDMYQTERAFLLKACVDCRRLGIDERRVQMSEDRGRELVRCLRASTTAVLALVRAALESGVLNLEQLAIIEAEEAPQAVAGAIRQALTEGGPS
jgi:hypothetical protein